MTPSSTTCLQRARPGRISAVLLLSLFVLGQLYSFFHHATTEHRTCVEEAALVHGHCHHDACEPTATAAAALEASTQTGDEGASVRRAPDQHEHELCSVLSCRQFEKWTPGGPVLVSHLASSHEKPQLSSLRIAVRGIPVFRLAPKQSPPEVA